MTEYLQKSRIRNEKEAREKHDERKRRQKEQHDKKHKAKEKEIRPGDKVMIRRKKTTLDTPWDPKEFQVTEIKGAKLILNRQGEVKHRAKNNVKQLKGREIQGERIIKKQPIEKKTRRELDLEVSWNKIRVQIRIFFFVFRHVGGIIGYIV